MKLSIAATWNAWSPVAALAGHFPDLPPIPKSQGVGVPVPDRRMRGEKNADRVGHYGGS